MTTTATPDQLTAEAHRARAALCRQSAARMRYQASVFQSDGAHAAAAARWESEAAEHDRLAALAEVETDQPGRCDPSRLVLASSWFLGSPTPAALPVGSVTRPALLGDPPLCLPWQRGPSG